MERRILAVVVAMGLSLGAAHAGSSWSTPSLGLAPASTTRSTGPNSSVYTYSGVPALRANPSADVYRSPIPNYRHVKWKAAPAKPARVKSLKASLKARKKALKKSALKRKTRLRKTTRSRKTKLTGGRRRTLY